MDEHREALTYDLLKLGLHFADIGTRRLRWDELKAVVRKLPPDSALSREIHGPDGRWAPLDVQLLAGIFDVLRLANWQRQGDPNKEKPEPLPRPGVTPPEGREEWVGKPRTMAEMNRLLGWKFN